MPYVSQCRVSQDRLKVSTHEIVDLFQRLEAGVMQQCAEAPFHIFGLDNTSETVSGRSQSFQTPAHRRDSGGGMLGVPTDNLEREDSRVSRRPGGGRSGGESDGNVSVVQARHSSTGGWRLPSLVEDPDYSRQRRYGETRDAR